MKVGITGSKGFIGYHLYYTLSLLSDEFKVVEFDRSYFNENHNLDSFVSSCDVIIHLAALNRHSNPDVIYQTNITLVNNLIYSLERTGSKAHIIIASSTQEELNNLYGRSKKDGRLLLSDWAKKNGASLSGLIIPNVFGPFGHPFYNSVVATFCYQVARGEKCEIEIDKELNLIYVGDLVNKIIELIRNKDNSHTLLIPFTVKAKVSELLNLINDFRISYQDKGEIPELKNDFEKKLFNTYRCYIEISTYFPKKLLQNIDSRGVFVEVVRQGIPGQTSFSTTLPGITRGNHFHTRKIERFAVIRGKALIQLRRIGTDEVHEFYLDGNEPSYVDMPIWYTHNIKNIGNEPLYTIFWINEPYNSNNPDTYFEKV
jgi:UDP-2-acetamido-2,6-beta-L-arabino-hexul-4-ose reductase